MTLWGLKRPHYVVCVENFYYRIRGLLEREQGLVEVRQAKFIAGAQPPKRVRSQANEHALKELIARYLYRRRMEFIRGILKEGSIIERLLFNLCTASLNLEYGMYL